MKKIIITLSMLSSLLLVVCGCTTPLTHCKVQSRTYESSYEYTEVTYVRGYPVYRTNYIPYKRYITLSGIDSSVKQITESIYVTQEEWDNVKQNQDWRDIGTECLIGFTF